MMGLIVASREINEFDCCEQTGHINWLLRAEIIMSLLWTQRRISLTVVSREFNEFDCCEQREEWVWLLWAERRMSLNVVSRENNEFDWFEQSITWASIFFKRQNPKLIKNNNKTKQNQPTNQPTKQTKTTHSTSNLLIREQRKNIRTQTKEQSALLLIMNNVPLY